jgi:hypothetical protein
VAKKSSNGRTKKILKKLTEKRKEAKKRKTLQQWNSSGKKSSKGKTPKKVFLKNYQRKAKKQKRKAIKADPPSSNANQSLSLILLGEKIFILSYSIVTKKARHVVFESPMFGFDN